MSLKLPVEETPPSMAVVEAVATREGVEPTDLDEPLFEVVDPDALDSLVRESPAGGGDSALRITFTYAGYEVRVGSDGSVHLSEAP